MKSEQKAGANGLNIRQQRFAELVVSGMSATQAYKDAGYKGTGHAAEASASKILSRVEVQAYIAQLRAPETSKALLTKDEKRAWLADLLRTPIGEIGPDSTLCMEYSSVEVGGGDRGRLRRGNAPEGNEVSGPPRRLTRVKMADKLRAIELDSKLAGHFEPDQLIVETGPKTLEAIKQRALNVVSALDASRTHQPAPQNP